ncbi:hypothetical protein PLICRDRAFT_175818 [Plicaturopsis crispa FD-325 SS-3]|nr:hypothetical protein PLICRDRAFT_175818 [Plicaturopsis crispa FD-325 SS-3]
MHRSFDAHGSSVVTCLIVASDRIISASDDHSIHGGVWAIAVHDDTLVSGSTDRTVRTWDLETGLCTHVFVGHASTVRCIAIVEPELVDVEDETGSRTQTKILERPLIVSGSRDDSLRVWDLPLPGETPYIPKVDAPSEEDPSQEAQNNPYHKFHLQGHTGPVRALAAKGRIAVSGSYDHFLRVWDIVTGKCEHVLEGHTEKVYNVVLDLTRDQVYSGSMDHTVRVWNLQTGQCQNVLTGHTSLVGLLGISPSYLVSASADATLRVWNPDTGELRHTLAEHAGAITCFQHDDSKVISGSCESLKIWDLRDGTVVQNVWTGTQGVWQVAFDGRWCVAASSRDSNTSIDIWDLGDEGVLRLP